MLRKNRELISLGALDKSKFQPTLYLSICASCAHCSDKPSEGGSFGGDPIIKWKMETEFWVCKIIMFRDCTKSFTGQICAFAINFVRTSKQYNIFY